MDNDEIILLLNNIHVISVWLVLMLLDCYMFSTGC